MKDVCVTYEVRPPRRLTTATKRCTCDYSLFVYVVLAILAQFPQHAPAAALRQQTHDVSQSFESAEDTLEFLHELARFIYREHKAGDVDDEHAKGRVYKRHDAHRALDMRNDEPAWYNVCGRDSGWSGDELAEDLSQDYIKLVRAPLKFGESW